MDKPQSVPLSDVWLKVIASRVVLPGAVVTITTTERDALLAEIERLRSALAYYEERFARPLGGVET